MLADQYRSFCPVTERLHITAARVAPSDRQNNQDFLTNRIFCPERSRLQHARPSLRKRVAIQRLKGVHWLDDAVTARQRCALLAHSGLQVGDQPRTANTSLSIDNRASCQEGVPISLSGLAD